MKPEQAQFLERIYKAQFSIMFKHAVGKVQDREIAMDIVQDTFHTAVEKIDVLMVHENPEAWLMVVLNNKIMQYYDRKKEEYTLLISTEEEACKELGEIDQQLKDIDECKESLLEKVKRILTPEEYGFFERFFIDNASHLALAKEYGITVYGTKKRRERMLAKLHKELRKIERENDR